MPTYEITGFKINPEGRDQCTNDLKAALRETGRELKIPIKKIRVVDDTPRFFLESTAMLDKVIQAIQEMGVGVGVKPATPYLKAFGEKYGLTQSE